MATLNEKFNQIKDSIANGIQDLTTLEVTTFTGNVTLTLGNITNDKGFDTKKIYDEIKTKLTAQASGELTLLAYTKIDIDQDSVTFVKANLSPDDAPLLEVHKSMVTAAQEGRKAFITLIKNII